MPLECTSFVFECPRNPLDPAGRVLRMAAKRYAMGDSLSNEDGLSVLYAHCIGSHKEQWEPVIAETFLAQRGKPRRQRVREAWAFDWQSHGDSALLNRDLVEDSRPMGVSAFEWADAIGAFARSPRMHGRRMVAVGHSAGAGAMVLSMQRSANPYLAIVLIEPTIMTPAVYYHYLADNTPQHVAATQLRRGSWASPQDAEQAFRRRAPWRKWDSRVRERFLAHGLLRCADGSVALKCRPRDEALAFPDLEPHFAALDEIARVCRAVPIHVVWAKRSELVPPPVQDTLSDPAAGRMIASVSYLDGGHMIVQENPSSVALSICAALDSIRSSIGIPTPQSLGGAPLSYGGVEDKPGILWEDVLHRYPSLTLNCISWLLPGSGSGFGLFMAQTALAKGDNVVATLRNPQVLEDLAAKYDKDRLLVLELDVTKIGDIAAAFGAAKECLPLNDTSFQVFNNAGSGMIAEVEGTNEQKARDLFDINFWGAFNVARQSVAFMRDVNNPRGGLLMNMSSMYGIDAPPGIAIYSAAKFALEAVSDALSRELDPAWNIKITVLCPGFFTATKGMSSTLVEPIHPAYDHPDNGKLGSVQTRNAISAMLGEQAPIIGDTDKLIGDFWDISRLEHPPSRVAFGDDAMALFQAKVSALKADLEASKRLSKDLSK
ncbi:unnamed protein product [Mycena citricolor]|uniref:AB hydrolase-1 domain-containing protein n=1 Tax=Mycena citricolor TaxID=2018698 RepID=A0AAD2H1H2_9AGAR|nr:unnamed protein product [Mycena citricolor]